MEEREQSTEVELAVPEAVVQDNQDAVEVEVEVLDDDLDATGEQPATEEEELEEIERYGKKYVIPKVIKNELLMHQDYTRKTQEAAEVKRTYEERQTELDKQAEFQQAHFDEIVKLNNVGLQLQQYQQVDWNALYDSDPVEAMKLDRQFNALKETYHATQTNIQQAQQQQALMQQQQAAKLIEQSRATLASEFKDWSPTTGKEVGEYLKTYSRAGVDDRVLRDIDRGVYGALPIILARKAQLYDQMIKKAGKPSAAPPPPVTKVGSKATVTKSVDQMTDKEFAAWRARQIKQRA